MSSIAVIATPSGAGDGGGNANDVGEDALAAELGSLSLSGAKHGHDDEDVPPGYYEMGNLESDVGLVYDPRMMDHKAPEDHPEQPQRVERIWSALEEHKVTPQCRRVQSREATDEELKRCHPQRHINKICDCFYEFSDVKKSIAQNSLEKHGYQHRIDEDTFDGPHSALAARLAAGSVIALTEAVCNGEIKSGFAVVRPPGHHCESDRAQGFCLFNSVAVAVRHAQAYTATPSTNTKVKANRVLILDWDVHHGNGTQDIFLNDSTVMFISLHRSDNGKFYPKSGFVKEVGKRGGKGYTVNIPWPCRGLGDKEYVVAFETIVMPICEEFNPDLVFVSAGFDAALGDPLGGMKVTDAGYAYMTKKLMTLANGRVIIALEGGYNLTSISNASVACAKALLGASYKDILERNASGESETPIERFAALARTGWAEEIDSRAIRTLNQVLAVQKDLWASRNDDGGEKNPFRMPLVPPSRTREGGSSPAKAKKELSLAERFALRKNRKGKKKKKRG